MPRPQPRGRRPKSPAEALIAHLKLAIKKMRRELYGSHSERGRKLVESQVLDQMELELEDLEAAAAEDELADLPQIKFSFGSK